MTLELQETLQKRLDETYRTKDEQMAIIRKLQLNLQSLLKKTPRRPRDTIEELDRKIAALERKRTITSMPLAEERQILKEISSVKKTKTQVDEYHSIERQVQEVKQQLNDVRDSLKDTLAAADEVQTVLTKVKLANKLECLTQDLMTQEVQCPKAKIGRVIGKSGAMITKIQQSCKVVVEVDQDSEIIKITGSHSSIQSAIGIIDEIIQMEEEEIKLEKELLQYLASKHVNVLQQIRQQYPQSFVDVSRSSGSLLIRGSPDDVSSIKSKVFGLDIVCKTQELQGKEKSVILGTKGATVDKLCADHAVSIELNKVDERNATAFVTGPPGNVESVMRQIEDLLNENREVTEEVEISGIIRNILLADGGRLVKAMQKEVSDNLPEGIGCYITIKKEPVSKDCPALLIKTKQSVISRALEMTKAQLRTFDDLSSSFSVDPYVVPRLIGKGGEGIRKLVDGKDVFIEVDKNGGEIRYGATTSEAKDEVASELKTLIENNLVLRIPSDSASLKSQYRELTRSSMKNELDGKVWLGIDEEQSSIILRGKKEDIEACKLLVEEYIANNYVDEVPITEEDQEALLVGGKKNKLSRFSEEMSIKLHIDRTKLILCVRGTRENVSKAVQKINQFLCGGDGHSVAKLTVNEQVVGAIIGKKGKTKQDLEAKHDGVTITISKSHVVMIRGPEHNVALCKIEIGKIISSARVTHSIPVTDEQKELLEKKDFLKKISSQIPVHMNIGDESIRVNGSFYDVKDAMSLIDEMITGEYKTVIELEPSQFSILRNTCRDPSHIQRMQDASGATIHLDLSAGSIVISGKKSNVKRAKDQVYGFLDFILPAFFERVKISKPLFSSVGQATALAEVSAGAGGVTVYLDRDLSLVVMRSNDKDMLNCAVRLLMDKISEAERLVYILEFSVEDSWILPAIIGKNGNKVSTLRAKHPNCKIDVSKEARAVTVVADTEESIDAVRAAILVEVDKARDENVFVNIPDDYVPQFIGKGGAHVKDFSAKHGAEIQRVKKGEFNFKISGDASNVQATKVAIDEWVSNRDESNAVLLFHLEKEKDVAFILGEKGSNVRAVQEEFKCKIDIDRKALIVTVKADTAEIRENVVNKLKVRVIEEREKEAAKVVSKRGQLEDFDIEPSPPTDDSTSHQSPSENIAINGKPRLRTNSQDSISSNEYPSKPVGIVTSKIGGKGKKHKKRMDACINQGTEEGKTLFAMLLGDE